MFSGAPGLGDTAGAHLPAGPYCLHFLALVQAGSTWWKRGCCVYFSKLYGCFKCEGKDPGYLYCQVSPCISLWGETKVLPCNPTSSLQLVVPRGTTPMEDMLHCLHWSFFSKMFPKIQGAHARHMLQGGWWAFTKLDCDFLKCHFTQFTPPQACILHPLHQDSLGGQPAVPQPVPQLGFPHGGMVFPYNHILFESHPQSCCLCELHWLCWGRLPQELQKTRARVWPQLTQLFCI